MTDVNHEIQNIDEQMALLAKRKSELLERTRSTDLETCRRLIKQYGFSKSELGLPGKAGAGKARATASKLAKYANPANPNETWTGHGRKPGWFTAALARGVQESSMQINR